ncbi:MAG: hypothetical protein FJ241_10530 [Nitrospira sp.]|nr:hypothetical protein [Nitrospira sp.]
MLEKDIHIHFPHFTILKASAGSGKTHNLTERFVQFILSERIPRNRLRNILAITFSNNAAKEMKERILLWLKSVYFNDPESVAELSRIITLDRDKMIDKAERLIDEIIDNYADFQVRTIDSFMATIFKASAIDFGYNPEFDILMNNDVLMEYAFNLFLRSVNEGTDEAVLFDEIIGIILEHKGEEAAYLWDPSRTLLTEIKKIYRKLSSIGKRPDIKDYSEDMNVIKDKIRDGLEMIENMRGESGLEKNRGSSYSDILNIVSEGRFADLIGKGLKKCPVNKPKKSDGNALDYYNKIADTWNEVVNSINQYISCYAHSFYMPYLKSYKNFSDTIESVKKQQGKVFIEDINRYLSEYLNTEIVPDMYFRIGETIFHYLIDEFQDTSPIQWRNLFPLLENSLSQGGSLFVVGDTKQAIYGFRDADYRIMKKCETENDFPSARHEIRDLGTNYRSLQRILDFNEKVFKEIAVTNDTYKDAADRSGLNDYIQKAQEGKGTSGYVEVTFFERNDEEPSERERIQKLIEDLTKRGYRYRDIAILTTRNEDVVKTTSWLNEKNILFISYSSLDIRRRKITGEIVSLLSFLDSPPDDLSFATFLLGEIFTRTLIMSHMKQSYPIATQKKVEIIPPNPPPPPFGKGGLRGILKGGMGNLYMVIDRERLREFLFTHREDAPLYKAFQKEFSNLWENYFAGLFKSAGYLPLYDLVTEIFSVFRVFELMEDEEATFAKILEVVKDFEGAGYNSLKDFLDFAIDTEISESEWDIDVPRGIDAVKVMTIHKAKGLGFPVVIVLLYGEKNRGFDYIVQEKEDEVTLMKINRKIAGHDAPLERLYNEEAMNEMVNKLNSLYVGFTRAGEELYVIGVKRERDKYPFDLLPAEGYAPSDKPDRILPSTPESIVTFPIHHHHQRIQFSIIPHELISIEERRRGEFIHRVLFFVDSVDEEFERELSQIIKRVKDEMAVSYPDDEVRATIMGILSDKKLRKYFVQKPDRDIKKEQEFVDSEGRLFRMDRVVIDEDRITVIDYKTGRDKVAEEDYMAQMRNYMKILRGVYPKKKIEGIIAYVDLKKVEKLKVKRGR